MRSALALLRAAHAGPTLAVTSISALIGWAAGAGWLGIAIAVLLGQLQVGWLNDLIDRDRDRRLARTEKPLVAGSLTLAALRTGIAIAMVAVVPVSFLTMGAAGGTLHLIAVASAQTYNIWLKRTLWSWLPYALSFAALPAAILMAAASAHPWRLSLAGALLGVAAHLANVVKDIDDDLKEGIRGLPQRIGARASTYLAIGLLILVAWILFPDVRVVMGLAVAAMLLALLRRALFPGLMLLATLDVVLLLDSLRP